MPDSARLLFAATLAVTLAGPAPAQTTSAPPPAAPPARIVPPPSPQVVGGLNCLLFGVAAATGAYVYGDVVMVAVAGSVEPALLIPLVAGAFVAGCGMGSILTPGLLYLGDWVF